MRAALIALALSTLAACGNPLYSPCNGQLDCGPNLRCLDLGGDQRLCTRACTTTKARAGYPEGFGNESLFEEGAGAQNAVATPVCSDQPVTVTSSDTDQQGNNILVESAGIVGTCRVSAAVLDDDAISSDSLVIGVCAPL